MTADIFDPDDLHEGIDFEAKLALGKDGQGALPKSIWETYSAFANTQGGIILLGVKQVKEKFEIKGIKNTDKVQDDFWSSLNDTTKVSANVLSSDDVRLLELESGLHVIRIEVPRARREQRPVFINGNPLGGTYRRDHSGDYRCSDEQVKRLIAEQVKETRDAERLENYSLDDIDLKSLGVYRNRLASLKSDHPFTELDNKEFLRSIGGWSVDRNSGDEGLTLAGLLMFGNQVSIQEVLPNYFLDYRERESGSDKTEWVDRLVPDGTWSGNLFDFYRQVIQRLVRDLKVPFLLEGDERIDETPVHRALRESLVNTLVHADYSDSVSILVVKSPEYFGFRNPGHMRVPIDSALAGGTSDCRNRNLQKMFSLIGLGEQAGSGIPRVLKNWKSQHYRTPELWEKEVPAATLMRLRTQSLLPQESIDGLTSLFGDQFALLDGNKQMALVTADVEGFVTNTRMQQLCELHPRDISNILKSLVDEKFLVTQGMGRATSYRIASAELVDLADMDFAMPASSQDPGGRSGLKDPSSGLKGTSSGSKDGSSGSKDGSSRPGESAETLALRQIARPVSESGRVAPEVTRKTILALCKGRFLSLDQLSQLLQREHDTLRKKFVKPMVVDGLLERRYPQAPNHENQSYRTVASDDEADGNH